MTVDVHAKTLHCGACGQVCAAASGGETQPDYFLMDEECRVEYGLASRCGRDLGFRV